MDGGIYGEPGIPDYRAVDTVRKLEAFAREAKGFQALYADNYQTRDEFRTMFDHAPLDKLRQDNGSIATFPEPYDKVSREART